MSFKAKIKLVMATLLTMAFCLSCSPTQMTGVSDSLSVDQGSSNIIGGPLESASIAIYEQTLFPVLRTNCAACHGTNQAPLHSVANVITSHTTVLSNSLADLKTPASSRFYLKINSGHQGFSPSTAMEILAAVTDWSNQLAALEDVVPEVPAPAPGPGPAPVPVPVPMLESTYASIRALILEPKCVSCHGPALARGGVRFDSYTNTMRTVRAGNPGGSDFYIAVESGNMPRSAPALGTQELNVISQWITNGALDN